MIIVGFEDSTSGQRRIVVEDLIGGQALKDDANADGRITTVTETPAGDGTPPLLKRYPPNGGVGMWFEAFWSWWPQDGADDELAFPKRAEIRECEYVNKDEEWLWGVYCGRKGIFPASRGRVLEVVGMV